MQDIKEYVNKLNNEFVEVVGGSYVRVDTGEIFTKTEVQKYVQLQLENYTNKNLEKIKQTSFKSLGVMPDQIIIKRKTKEKHKNNKDKYDGGDFNIVYRNKILEVHDMKLEVNEKLVYYVLRDFIAYPSNCIMINEQIPTFTELENVIGLKERTIRKVIKSLEEKGLFKLMQSGHRKAIYVNPIYYASGKELNIETLEIFGLVECDSRKVESYINNK